MRSFEKITFDEFKKIYGDNIELYRSYSLPYRTKNNSSQYCFELIESYMIKPNMTIYIPTGIKVEMNPNEFLSIQIDTNIKNLRMPNDNIILDMSMDKDCSHIKLQVKNEGTGEITLRKGDIIAKAMFHKYLVVDSENNVTKL